ncbi:PGC-1 and ERR-induced regulator in muscle protein 1 [Spea bombifrons]|uniref:PGC-1 and ERR-induced regulator in muscle protein 1 n=1 Tax=Spea bombifrons TaxID=233779 RepID=UPI00234BEC6E|nr:PGC-1 and ERR-induced regulator in muscle protein 1 [Spea bombifrons]
MDNFEYSIQINDRDWAEFYSTAEECGMIQVSLATEEELLLSDPEPEESTSRPKFIKVSLCPPQEDHQAIQSTPTAVSSAQQTCYTWKDLNEDLLSGSEEEEEFGSVSRFLCQRDTHLYKTRKVDVGVDIPIPNPAKEQHIEHLEIEGFPVSLVDHMRALNRLRIQQHGEIHNTPDTNALKRTNIPAISDKGEDTGHSGNGCASSEHQTFSSRIAVVSVQQHKTNDSLNSPQSQTSPSVDVIGVPLPDHKEDSKMKKSMNCPGMPSNVCEMDNKSSYFDGTSPDQKEVPIACIVQDYHKETCLLSMMKDIGEAQNESEKQDFKVLSRHNGSSESFFCGSMGHNGLAEGIETPKAMAHSSAVQQNFQGPNNGTLTMWNPASFSLENAKACVRDAPTHELDSNFRVATTVNNTTPTCSHTANNITDQTLYNEKSSTKVFLTQHKQTGLTIPEMYDFFYDDISETNMAAKPETQASREEGIMYSPDMYEYFFLETQDEEDRCKLKGEQRTKEGAETELMLSSAEHPTSESFCVPEAYEFFFADGTDDQKTSEGIHPPFHKGWAELKKDLQ